MGYSRFYLPLLILTFVYALADAEDLKSELLCRQCSACDTNKCPPSESYPHMTRYDDSLIAGALQSEFVSTKDRGVYSVPKIFKAVHPKNTMLIVAGNQHLVQLPATIDSETSWTNVQMDICSDGQSYLTVDKHGKVSLRALKSLDNLAEADWKSISPPPEYNHREFRFWLSYSTGKCLTVFGGNSKKRNVGVADCRFDGTSKGQLFAFRFHYHKAFCCCGIHNN